MGCDEVNTSQDSDRDFPLLVDTHVLLWLIEGYGTLGRNATAAIDLATGQNCLIVSAITPWEIGLLVNKGRLKLNTEVMGWIRSALAKPGVQLAPLEPEIAVESTRLPWEIHSDPADRILVATARTLGATLVTADQGLLAMAAGENFKAMDATL
jgi:PIN domain nuclease of toxin-antitoxin system